MKNKFHQVENIIIPKPLQEGDRVAILSASGPCDSAKLADSIEQIKAFGLKVQVMDSCYKSHGYLAGEDKLRLEDIHKAFADKNIKGILAARGGYGSARLLPFLDYEMIRQNPKRFIGFSDVTALHTVFNRWFATFHGPMPVSCFGNMDAVTVESYKKALFGDVDFALPQGLKVLYPGSASGILTGGNLTVIASLLGTPYEIKTRGRILFLEEIQEEPYRVDRLLLQLKLAGKLSDAAGIVFGDFYAAQADVEGALAVGGTSQVGTRGWGFDFGGAMSAGGSQAIGNYTNPNNYPTLLLGNMPDFYNGPGGSHFNIYGGPFIVSNALASEFCMSITLLDHGLQWHNGANIWLRSSPGLSFATSDIVDDFFQRARHDTIQLSNTLTQAHFDDRGEINVQQLRPNSDVFLNLGNFIPRNLQNVEADRTLVIDVVDQGHVVIVEPYLPREIGEYDLVVLNFPNASTVEFQPAAMFIGTEMMGSSNPNLTRYAERILWSFPMATHVKVSHHDVVGSVFAPNAHYEANGGSTNGMLITERFTTVGGHELHAFRPRLRDEIFNIVPLPPETTTPTEVTDPPETTTPTEATDPSATTTPTEATDPSETTIPTEATDPSETTAPTEVTDPPETSAPTEATDPSETTAPTEVTDPSETTIPTEATDPSETTAPTEATDPSEISDPTEVIYPEREEGETESSTLNRQPNRMLPQTGATISSAILAGTAMFGIGLKAVSKKVNSE